MDLRVEDSPHPIVELERLVRTWRAYRNVDQGDAYATEGKIEDAMKAYAEGARLAPGTTRSSSGRPPRSGSSDARRRRPQSSGRCSRTTPLGGAGSAARPAAS